jgi:FtsP/CotA-like multicopper oxidase with cupredoxin domain
MDRRHFLKTAAACAGSLALVRSAIVLGQSVRRISKFRVTLPGLGRDGTNNMGNYIPVLSPNTTAFPGTDYYEIVARQFTQNVHPHVAQTRFWGYADAKTLDSRYLGGVIVSRHGRPVKLKVTNLLPSTHILPVDPSSIDEPMEAEVGGRVDRITVHLHGGVPRWTSDGGPASWFTNARNPRGFRHGSSFLNGSDPGSAIYDYPNDQSSRLVWYHDHAYGITRLNAYAGLASAFLVTDDAEAQLIKDGLIPDVPGYPLGVPLIIQDKSFVDGATDPSYPVSGARPGDLWYPHVYAGPPIPDMKLPASCGRTGRWKISGGRPPSPSLVPEAFFDTNLVNGAPYPVLRVSPRRYRFRVLNGAQARFYNLQLYVADGSRDGITLKTGRAVDNHGNPLQVPANPAGPRIIQIGKDSGFLPAPVVLNNPPQPVEYVSTSAGDPTNGNVRRYTLLLSPGERADIIVDFRGFEGSSIILYNDAPAPFPSGDIRNDYYPGAPNLSCIGGAATPRPGEGPDTRTVMRFDVDRSGAIREPDFNATLSGLSARLPRVYAATLPGTPATRVPPKVKTLDENFDEHGRLLQQLGSPDVSGYLSTPVDVVSQGETQVWQIYNLTGDTHPMHLHLVNVQIVRREAWRADSDGNPLLPLRPVPGSARPPDPNEAGWKETFRANPGEVTTIITTFDMPPGAPPSPRLQASYGIRGAEYVWHCHILEHEEHDMMHALVVV